MVWFLLRLPYSDIRLQITVSYLFSRGRSGGLPLGGGVYVGCATLRLRPGAACNAGSRDLEHAWVW